MKLRAFIHPAVLFKKRLQQRRFSANFAKFLRTTYFLEYLWWLLSVFHFKQAKDMHHTDMHGISANLLIKKEKFLFLATESL